MKIIRFLGGDAIARYGIVEGDTGIPETAKIIEGEIFSGFHISQKSMEVKKLLAPVDAAEILAIGLNYKKHADETRSAYPDAPVLFIKARGSLIGHEEIILLPAAGPQEVDFEGELAVIIGRRGKNIPVEQAREYISGYTCANDVSARDWQLRLQKKQWSRGKSFDTFCPLGPWMVTADEVPDPNSLYLRTELNGRTVQDSHTGDMIFNVWQLVSNLSRSMTLHPGTVILTGTPEGVGFTRRPPLFLRPGDRVSVTIEKLGTLSNPVQLEPQPVKRDQG